jgi:hypothetical protein
MNVREDAVRLGLVIDSEVYARLLVDFTEATDKLLEAMAALLSLINMAAPAAEQFRAIKDMNLKVTDFYGGADSLLEKFVP